MDLAAAPRTRTASAVASGVLMDFGSSFQPSKRQKIAAEDHEMDANTSAATPLLAGAAVASMSLLDRLVYEVSSGSSSASMAWRLSNERSVAQNESYLNEQLEHAALLSGASEMTPEHSRLPFSALLQDREDAERVEAHVRHAMDIVSWLLVVRHQDLRQQEQLMDRQRVLEKDVERKQHQLTQFTLEVEGLKQQLAQQENMFHGREQALVAERRALQSDRKHLEVLCAKLQGQETAFKTQLRRKDVEYERLKKSLQDAAQRSSKEVRGMAMGKALNGLSERRQTQAQRVTQTPETLMNRRLIENLEQKRDDLLLENDALARTLENLQRQVESVSVQYKKAVQLFLAHHGDDEDRTDETLELARVPLDDFMPAPLQLGVKANVSTYIAETVDKLTEKVQLFERAMQAELAHSVRNPNEDLVEALKEKLEDAHAIIAEQDRLLQASLLPASSLGTTDGGAKKPEATTPHSTEKENIHINTGKQSQAHIRGTSGRPGARRRPVEQLMLEQWTDELEAEWTEAKRKHKHLDDERKLLQRQGESLDQDRLAFEMRTFEHFFGSMTRVDDSEDVVMEGMDCPTTPRTAAYLRSIGIHPTVVETPQG